MGDKVYPSAPHPTPPAYYPLKDQPLPYPATYRVRKHRDPCCCCFKWLCSCIVLLFVAFGIAALVFWLVVRPKLPEYDVTDVRLSGLDTSLASGTLNTEVTFTLDTYNPNKKMGFYYDNIDIRVESLDMVVGKGSIPAFYQGHKNRTIIESSLKSDTIALPVEKKDALLAANTDKSLWLKVKVDVKTRIKVGDIKTDKIKVKVRCDVNIDPTRTGSQLLSKRCKVKS